MHQDQVTEQVPASGAVAVRVRYFAGARTAAGTAEETVRVAVRDAGVVRAQDVIDAVLAIHDQQLAKIVPACSFLLDGLAVRDRAASVSANSVLDVLPPFAGG